VRGITRSVSVSLRCQLSVRHQPSIGVMSPPSLGGDTDTNGGGEWGNKFRGMAGGWMAVQTPAFGRVAGFGIGGGLGGGEMPLAPHGAQNGAANLGRKHNRGRDQFRPLSDTRDCRPETAGGALLTLLTALTGDCLPTTSFPPSNVTKAELSQIDSTDWRDRFAKDNAFEVVAQCGAQGRELTCQIITHRLVLQKFSGV
jgi:hypothetical protein